MADEKEPAPIATGLVYPEDGGSPVEVDIFTEDVCFCDADLEEILDWDYALEELPPPAQSGTLTGVVLRRVEISPPDLDGEGSELD